MFGKPAIALSDAEWLYLLALAQVVSAEDRGEQTGTRRVKSQRRKAVPSHAPAATVRQKTG